MTGLLRIALALATLAGGATLILASASEQRLLRRVAVPATTVQAARRALIRTPLDDRALEALVRADDAAHRWDEENRLISLANRLTPRNLPIRFMHLASAAANGALADAVRDADLLLRQRAYEAPVFTFLANAIALPDGREAIAARLALRPPWREELLIRRLASAPVDHADAVALLVALKATAAPPTTAEVEALAAPLVAAPDVEAAWNLRATFAPATSGTLLIDHDFSRGDSSPSALLGWQFAPGTIRDGAPGLPLGGHDGVTAQQITFAGGGRHLLRWVVRGLADDGTPATVWTMRCLSPSSHPLLGLPHSERRATTTLFYQTVDIPPACAMQILSLGVEGPSLQSGQARVTSIWLTE